jgi:hypothetical protein
MWPESAYDRFFTTIQEIVPKYSHKRPLPQENSFVFVSGFVFDTVEDDHHHTSQFVIGVRDMVFGGRRTMTKEQTGKFGQYAFLE